MWTIGGMNGRMAIPITFACFALLIVVLWAYLGGEEEDVIRRVADADRHDTPSVFMIDHAARRDPARKKNPLHKDAIHVQPDDSVVRDTVDINQPTIAQGRHRLEPDGIPWFALIGRFGPKLDEFAVDTRNRLVRCPIGQFVAGRMAMDRGHLHIAIPYFDGVLRQLPDNTAAMSAKASAMVALGRRTTAASLYEKVVALDPQDIDARYNYGVLLMRMAHFGEAAEQFRGVVRVEPRHVRAQYNLAGLSQRAGQLGEARDAWRVVTQLRPDMVGAWFNLGVISMDFDDPYEAMWCFTEVTSLSPEDPNGFINLARAQLAIGQLDLAMRAIQQANAIAPCDPTIMRHMAELHEHIASLEGSLSKRHRLLASAIREKLSLVEEEPAGANPMLAGGGGEEDPLDPN